MHTTLSKTVAGVATLAGLIASAGFAAVPAYAASGAAGPVSGQFALAPAPGANGEARPYFMMTVAPGSSAEDVIVFGNEGPTPEKFRVGVTDGSTAANSGSSYDELTGKCAGPACWVDGLPATITLPAHTREEVRFRVAVPAHTRPEQYLAGITATPALTPKPVAVHSNGRNSTKVIIVNRVTIGVAVTVGSLRELRTELKITGVTAGWIDGIVRLGVGVRNDGQRFTKGTGDMSCALDGTKRTYPVNMDTVLPGDGASLPVNGTGMRTGSWLCAVRIKDSGGHIDTWSGEVTVPAAVAAATKQIAANDYVAPSGGGVPTWAIGLFVMAGLILFSLWAVLLRRGRNRNLSS